jgi:DNA polymerase III alpha subunit
MRFIRGISRAKVEGIERARREGMFTSVGDLARRSGVAPSVLARLAAADAFGSMELNRREALWQVLALGGDERRSGGGEPSLLDELEVEERRPMLPVESLKDRVVQDYEATGMSLTVHPMSLLRQRLKSIGVIDSGTLKGMPHGRWVKLAGLVLVRQRPSTAGGVIFYTLEDERGMANLIVRPKVYERYRPDAYNSVAVVVEGRVERQGQVVHVQVERIKGLSRSLARLQVSSRSFH